MKPHRVGSLALIAAFTGAGLALAQEPKPTVKPATAAPPAAKRPPVKPAPKATPTPAPTPTPEPTPPPRPPDPRPHIAVMAFDYGTIQSQWWGTYDIGAGIADQIVDALLNDGSFRVIERKKLDTILAEQDFAQSDRAAPDAAKMSKVGKVAGVRFILTGSITQFQTSDRNFGAGKGVGGQVAKSMLGPVGGLSFRKVKHEVKLTARLIDTTTGEVVVSATGEGRSNKGQGAAVEMNPSGGGSGVGFSMSSSDYRASGIAEAQEKATIAIVQAIVQKGTTLADATAVKGPVVSH